MTRRLDPLQDGLATASLSALRTRYVRSVCGLEERAISLSLSLSLSVFFVFDPVAEKAG